MRMITRELLGENDQKIRRWYSGKIEKDNDREGDEEEDHRII